MKRLFLNLVVLMLIVLILPGCAAVPAPSVAAGVPSQSSGPASAPVETAGEVGALVIGENYRTVTPAQGKQLLASGDTVLVDVRTQEEYGQARIPGALLLPYDQIDEKAASGLIPAKDTPVVVYCRTGRRSAIAAKALVGLGYTQVYDLGGIQDWPYDTVSGS